ncbi:MAG: hypothetical protein WC829_16405 [Hyphomicrobium sp.]|jgi:predicted flap endonuclease-1-like 5' DNA nuclease
MSELLWQATLLLFGAFFFGAVVACSLKRRFYYGRSSKTSDVAISGIPYAPAPGEPKVEVAPRGEAEGERFNRAISGQTAAPAAPIAAAPPKPAPAPTPASAPASASPPVAAPAPIPAPAPVVAAVVPPVAKPVSAISVASGSGAPLKPQEGGAAPSDDLTRIRGIDTIIQKQLKDAGIRHFTELAALTAADIKGLGESLGLKGRIEQENWVGQAHILATGGETYYSRRVDRGMPVPIFIEPAVRVAAEPAPQPAAAISKLPLPAASSGPGNDLTRVRGIDSAIQVKLNGFGVRRFEELAALTAADVKSLNDALGLNGRMDQENWVGQAHILATGGETYYSRRRDRTAAAPAAPIATPAAPVAAAPLAMPAAPAPVELQASAPAAASPSADLAPLRSVRSEALVGTEAARMSRPARDNDDLKRIRGIGVLIEKKLNSLGIVHYEQVANWTGADIERISNILDFKGRIEREAWIEQARILATGGQTEFSRRSEA